LVCSKAMIPFKSHSPPLAQRIAAEPAQGNSPQVCEGSKKERAFTLTIRRVEIPGRMQRFRDQWEALNEIADHLHAVGKRTDAWFTSYATSSQRTVFPR